MNVGVAEWLNKHFMYCHTVTVQYYNYISVCPRVLDFLFPPIIIIFLMEHISRWHYVIQVGFELLVFQPLPLKC